MRIINKVGLTPTYDPDLYVLYSLDLHKRYVCPYMVDLETAHTGDWQNPAASINIKVIFDHLCHAYWITIYSFW
jgi:hypothetical protein